MLRRLGSRVVESSGPVVQPALTIVTPCLNVAATLADTLLSVSLVATLLQQRGLELDYLLIDGGSADGTLAIIADFCLSHPYVRVYTQINGGPYAAMNVGLRKAKGVLTHILNADDLIWDPPAYVVQIERALFSNTDLILSPIYYFKRPGHRLQAAWPLPAVPDDLQRWHCQIRNGLHYPHPGFIARTLIYRTSGFDERFTLSADYKLMQSTLLALSDLRQIAFSDQVLVAMATGGLTARWRSVLLGYFQLSAINRELAISYPFWRRYGLKVLRRLRFCR